MSRYLSFNAWGPRLDYGGDLNLIVVNFDWTPFVLRTPYASATLGLFGFCACLTWWPKGKYDDFGPNVPVEDLGGKPCYYENGEPVYWEKGP